MENRIGEQLSLFADRVGAETTQGNQKRIYFSAIATAFPNGLPLSKPVRSGYLNFGNRDFRSSLMRLAAARFDDG